MNKPLVSVIIPAHNGALYLKDAIQSVLNQTYHPIEILVIDNASQDETAQIVQQFPSVCYIYSDIMGTAQARNLGISHARGSLLAFLDQDDTWNPEKLEKQCAFLEKNPQVGAVVCRQQMRLEPGTTKPHWLKAEFLHSGQFAYLPSALLVRREILDSFDPSYKLTSDVDWFFRAKHQGIEVAEIPEVLLDRRIHNHNASNECDTIHTEILSILRASLRKRREKVSVIIPVYNGEKYLKEAVDSVLHQDYANIEILVVDDGSTDSTPQIIEKFGSKIRSIRQVNRGLGAARNKGISLATGEYLAFLDHDDLWEPTKISSQMKMITAEDPLIFGHVKQFICDSLSEEERKKLKVDETELPSYFAGVLLISKKRFLQIGSFLEQNVVGEFVDWYARALEAKVPIVMLPQRVLLRRVHHTNMGRQRQAYNRLEYLKILKMGLERKRNATPS